MDKFIWRRYLAERISRLCAVLIVALLLVVALDYIGLNYFNTFGFYTNATKENVAVVSRDFSKQRTLSHFVGNLCMLQNIKVKTFGSNGPQWSIAHEWWYYLLFPLGLFVLRGTVFERVACGTPIELLCWFLTTYVLFLFGVWLVRVVAWWLNGRSLLPWWIALPVFSAGMGSMRLEANLFPFAIGFTD